MRHLTPPFRVVLLAVIACFLIPSQILAAAPKPRATDRDRAREALIEGEIPAALLSYQKLAATTNQADLAAEYAYVLCLAGFSEAAFQQIDRARQLDPGDPAVWYFASRILRLTGHGTLASAIWPEGRKGTPDWIQGKASQVESAKQSSIGSGASYGKNAADRFMRANILARQDFCVSAAVAFEKALEVRPSDAALHAGYSITLEKLGCYALAARESERARELTTLKGADFLARRAKALRVMSKASPAPGVGRKPGAVSGNKGRWLAYGGGDVTSIGGNTNTHFAARLGKFVTENLDIAGNVDVLSSPGVDATGADTTTTTTVFGCSARVSKRTKASKPLSVSLGVKAGFAKDSNGVVISPGMSQEMKNGTLDMYMDFGTGPYKGVGLIMGYTIYLGMPR